MKGRRPTYRELEETITSLTDRMNRLERMLGEKDRMIEETSKRLRYYENENSPPSSDSLEWKRQRAQRRKDASGQDGGTGTCRRRAPGGQEGHRGVSRKHRPQSEETHEFKEAPRCQKCGSTAKVNPNPLVRDIIDIEIAATETRRRIRTAACGRCGTACQAPSGLPKKGCYGPKMVGLISALRAARVPFGLISKTVLEATGVAIAKSTAINVTGRVCDAMRPGAGAVMGAVKRSKNVGIDETVVNLAGRQGYAWTIQSKKNIAITYSRSRGALVMDIHMDGYGGTVTSDKYSVYKRFDEGDRHQICWAHELRMLLYASQKYGAPLSAGILHRQVQKLYRGALDAVRKKGRHSPRLRRRFESGLRNILFSYRGAEGTVLAPLTRRLASSLPHLFVFLEHGGVEPTNNASERALRHVVVSRKISGQIKGGQLWMDRWSWYMTCVLTWKMKGRSLTNEISKII